MLKPLSRARRSAQRGQALLEAALVTATLLFMVIFIMDMGQMLMFMQYFSDRARVGARYSAVNTFDPAKIRNEVVYGDPDRSDGEADRGGETPGFMGLTPSHVQVNRYDADGDLDRVEVSIEDFPLRFYTPLLAGVYHHAPFRAIMPVESGGATE